MKKIILVTMILLLGATMFGQTKLRRGLEVGASASSTLMTIDSIADFNSQAAFFNGADTIPAYTPVADQQDLGLVVQLLSDTALYFAPMIGAGNAGDTVLFSTTDVIYGFKWGGSHNLVLTKVTGVVYGTTPDIDIAVLKDVNFRDATPTEVLSVDLTITSTTTGNSATSFASATIAPDDYVWIRVDQATAQPTQCLISLYGYLTEL